MFASLLPGLRELRAPLAAGYLWLLFVYFVAGTPTELTDTHGPLRDLLTILPELGKAATGIAVSFAAYLVGSLSQDLFGQILPRGLQRASRLLPRPVDLSELRIAAQIAELMGMTEHVDVRSREVAQITREPQRGEGDAEARDLRREVRGLKAELEGGLEGLRAMLDEFRAAGASEAEKPEAVRPMVEAEENLRVAIVPPFVAVMVALTFESLIWAVGVIFAVALFVQAVARRAEADRLAAQHYRSLSVEETETELKELRRALERDEDVDLRRLHGALRRLPFRVSSS